MSNSVTRPGVVSSTVIPPPMSAPPPPPPPPSGAKSADPVVVVVIDTPGATIRVEAHGDLADVSDTALRLFRDAGGWPKGEGPAYGFTTDRRPTSTTAPVGNGRYGIPSAPITAGFTQETT